MRKIVWGLLLINVCGVAHADVSLHCRWTVKTTIETRLLKNGKISGPYHIKSINHLSPPGCAGFSLKGPGVPAFPKEKYNELPEAYQSPDWVRLTCPSGYEEAQPISWGQTAGVTRTYLDGEYYLDFYQATLPCIKND